MPTTSAFGLPSRTPEPAPDERDPAQPLLPPLLSGPASFLWLWVLPMALLLALNLRAFELVSGNMDAKELRNAGWIGAALGLDLLAGLLCWGVARDRLRAGREDIARHPAWGLVLIGAHVCYLWAATVLGEDTIPREARAWILPPERYLFNQYAFAMIPLFLGVLRLACAGRAETRGRVIAMNVGLAVLAPAALYLLGLVVLGSGSGLGHIPGVVLACGFVAAGLLLFVCVVRALMSLLRGRVLAGPAGQCGAVIVVALVLPLAGLALNRGIPFPSDLQAPEVYLLTCANAALLLVAVWSRRARPRAVLFTLGATFPFTLYFFFVFLPFTPLAVLAILALGAGFLILTPTLLFGLHIHLLWQALQSARETGRRLAPLVLWVLAGVAVLPGWFTFRGLADRSALNTALEHAFTPGTAAAPRLYAGSLVNLRRAISSHRAYKDGRYYPLLSDYYAWLVFDGLVLPDGKLERLETLFFGAATPSARERNGFTFFGADRTRDRHRMPRAEAPPRTVEVAEMDVHMSASSPTTTTAGLSLTLKNTGARDAEYVAELPLPPGVVVSGFRLYVNGRPVPGRIVEKKTALWVYAMIRDTERRDPGLLFYTASDRLELRVFPVVAGTPAVVEIDFLVPAPATAMREGRGPAPADAHDDGARDPAVFTESLRGRLRPVLARPAAGDVVVAGLGAVEPPPVSRPRYLHLLVDRSAANAFTGDPALAIRELSRRFATAAPPRVTLVNHEVLPLPSSPPSAGTPGPAADAEGWQKLLPARGGCHLDLALAQAIRLHRDEDLDGGVGDDAASAAGGGALPPRPVFVILSGTASPRSLDLPLTEAWLDLLPGLELHELGADGGFVTHRAAPPDTALARLGGSMRPVVAHHPLRFAPPPARASASAGPLPLAYWEPAERAWREVRDFRIIDSTRPETQGVDRAAALAAPSGDEAGRWVEAMALQLARQDRARDPGAGDSVAALRESVAAARRLGVLTPDTSFIVVENEAQWRAMDRAEAKKLGQHEALEHREKLETPAPPALVVAALVALVAGLRRWISARFHRRFIRASRGCGRLAA